MFAIDRFTGEPRWTYEASQDGGESFHGNPVVHSDLILVGSDGAVGHVYAFQRATGNLLWKYDAGSGGSYFDLLVVQRRVIALTATEGVVALDVRTGAKAWNFQLRPAPYSSPATDGKYVFVADADGTVYALNAANGKVRWSRRLGAQPSNTVRLAGTAIIVGTSKTSWDEPWSTGSSNSHSLYRLDAAMGKVQAKILLPAKPLGSAVLIGNVLVVYSGNDLIGVDSRMRLIWRRPAPHQNRIPRVQVWSGAVIAPSDPKAVVLIDPNTGTIQWRKGVGDGVTTLQASEEVLYVGVAGGKLHAYQVARKAASHP